jgi:hypothetical protein
LKEHELADERAAQSGAIDPRLPRGRVAGSAPVWASTSCMRTASPVTKQQVLGIISESFQFPKGVGKNFDGCVKR